MKRTSQHVAVLKWIHDPRPGADEWEVQVEARFDVSWPAGKLGAYAEWAGLSCVESGDELDPADLSDVDREDLLAEGCEAAYDQADADLDDEYRAEESDDRTGEPPPWYEGTKG
jgi:hypothetical protein